MVKVIKSMQGQLILREISGYKNLKVFLIKSLLKIVCHSYLVTKKIGEAIFILYLAKESWTGEWSFELKQGCFF